MFAGFREFVVVSRVGCVCSDVGGSARDECFLDRMCVPLVSGACVQQL